MEFSRQEYWSGLPFPELPDPGNYASCGAFQVVLVVKNPPANAGDMGSIPGQGTKILHALEQLNPSPSTSEPVHHS